MQHSFARLRWTALLAAAVLFCVPGPQSALSDDDNPVAPTRDTDVVKPQPVCENGAAVPISISAPVYEMLGPKIRARGGLLFDNGKEKIRADEIEYDTDTDIGYARNIFLTTCRNVDKPDWHITASSATLLPSHRLRARNVSVYAGRTRLLVLPSMNIRVGGRSSTNAIFPRLGYDSRDGVTLAQTLRLTDTTHSRTTMDLKLTTLHSIQGELRSLYGVGGRISRLPGRYLTYGSMRSRALEIPDPPAECCDPQLLRPVGVARLQPFGRITLRQRTYDANNLGLVVFRQPELGVTYVGRQLSIPKKQLDPRVEIYPQITTSWGRFKEIPGHGDYQSRELLSAEGAFNAVWMGPRTAIQPLGIATYANYGDGEVFRTWGFGVDVSHLACNGSFYSARYISRTSSGSTPFLFDDVDIAKEIDLALQTYRGKYVLGFAANYDATNGSLFDWEILLGRRSDCLGTYVRWDNRFQRLSLDLTLVNL